ncbi:2-oxoglutarate and iron-dependent oxygenase domain-containing protein 2-like [Thunnus maccoyii]|uniref:2-oxoglutarate and iron-dependent oxygenase domain-containing protein 2-like n=1 Tax=Thunnus maccoyii TaxID=8240 RepID=UPI001C4C8685|nr:2-oxoglutarate and iron-dependent oxygenase domain-containing protein 2-like [Thunnus maccoyii]
MSNSSLRQICSLTLLRSPTSLQSSSRLLSCVAAATPVKKEEAAPRVYRFPVFEKSFCKELVEELEHFEQSSAPKGRPNTMNHYGILLNELGFDEGFITPLRQQYLHPLTSLLYPDCGGRCLDSHKAFVVKYDINEDVYLSYHYDNAEVTLNVSLGNDFTEGNLYFGDMRQVIICCNTVITASTVTATAVAA